MDPLPSHPATAPPPPPRLPKEGDGGKDEEQEPREMDAFAASLGAAREARERLEEGEIQDDVIPQHPHQQHSMHQQKKKKKKPRHRTMNRGAPPPYPTSGEQPVSGMNNASGVYPPTQQSQHQQNYENVFDYSDYMAPPPPPPNEAVPSAAVHAMVLAGDSSSEKKWGPFREQNWHVAVSWADIARANGELLGMQQWLISLIAARLRSIFPRYESMNDELWKLLIVLFHSEDDRRAGKDLLASCGLQLSWQQALSSPSDTAIILEYVCISNALQNPDSAREVLVQEAAAEFANTFGTMQHRGSSASSSNHYSAPGAQVTASTLSSAMGGGNVLPGGCGANDVIHIDDDDDDDDAEERVKRQREKVLTALAQSRIKKLKKEAQKSDNDRHDTGQKKGGEKSLAEREINETASVASHNQKEIYPAVVEIVDNPNEPNSADRADRGMEGEKESALWSDTRENSVRSPVIVETADSMDKVIDDIESMREKVVKALAQKRKRKTGDAEAKKATVTGGTSRTTSGPNSVVDLRSSDKFQEKERPPAQRVPQEQSPGDMSESMSKYSSLSPGLLKSQRFLIRPTHSNATAERAPTRGPGTSTHAFNGPYFDENGVGIFPKEFATRFEGVTTPSSNKEKELAALMQKELRLRVASLENRIRVSEKSLSETRQEIMRSEKTVKRMTIIIAGQEAAVAQLLEQKVKTASEVVEAGKKRLTALLELMKERRDRE